MTSVNQRNVLTEADEAYGRLSVNVTVQLAKRMLQLWDQRTLTDQMADDEVYDFLDDILAVFYFIPNLSTSGIKKMQVGITKDLKGIDWYFLLNNDEKVGTTMVAWPEFFTLVMDFCKNPKDKAYLLSEINNIHKQVLIVDF